MAEISARALSEWWSRWQPHGGYRRVLTVDAHAEGEPLRVIVNGFPVPHEGGILERRRFAHERLDELRTALMWEPRGHADMYGCVITPPASADADFGVLFMHNDGYSTMCGHGIIAVTTVVLEIEAFPVREPVTSLRIDTPAGLVVASARIDNGRVAAVAFRNVPSFVVELGAAAHVPEFGEIHYDLAFGGAFYAYVSAHAVGLEISPENSSALIAAGTAIKRAVAAGRVIEHPRDAELGFLYGTIFTGPAQSAGAHSRNVCVFADGEVDRSPTGTGVSGRLAILYARSEVAVNEPIVIESIVGSHFTGRVLEETRVGDFKAIVPEVEGRAWITGRHEFLIDETDPFGRGFLVR